VLLKYNNSARTCELEIHPIAALAFIENLIEFRVTNRRLTFLLKSYCLTVLLSCDWNIEPFLLCTVCNQIIRLRRVCGRKKLLNFLFGFIPTHYSSSLESCGLAVSHLIPTEHKASFFIPYIDIRYNIVTNIKYMKLLL